MLYIWAPLFSWLRPGGMNQWRGLVLQVLLAMHGGGFYSRHRQRRTAAGLVQISSWVKAPTIAEGNGRSILQTGFFHLAFSIMWMFISMLKLLPLTIGWILRMLPFFLHTWCQTVVCLWASNWHGRTNCQTSLTCGKPFASRFTASSRGLELS